MKLLAYEYRKYDHEKDEVTYHLTRAKDEALSYDQDPVELFTTRDELYTNSKRDKGAVRLP